MRSHLTSAIMALCAAFARLAIADVPVPPPVLNPTTIEESWNVVRLATANVSRLLDEKRIDEVTPQISLCSPALRMIARHPTPGVDEAIWNAHIADCFRSVNLMAQNGLQGNLDGANAVFANFQASLSALRKGVDLKIVEAEVFHCPNHPEILALQAGRQCDICKTALLPRRIPYSFIYVTPKDPVVKMSATRVSTSSSSSGEGEKTPISLQLRDRKGQPVTPAELIISHSKPVHAFIVDESLRELQLLDVSPTNTSGEFSTSFAPSSNASAQRLWAAVIPAATGLQEFPRIDIPSKGSSDSSATPPAAPLQESDTLSASVANWRFRLTPVQGRTSGALPTAGQLQILQLEVTDEQGHPVSNLEPLLNAFSHLVAVYKDRETVSLFHPTGGDILREDLRGGPKLTFKVYWPKDGYVRLFCLVKLDGKIVSVPLGLTVAKSES